MPKVWPPFTLAPAGPVIEPIGAGAAGENPGPVLPPNPPNSLALDGFAGPGVALGLPKRPPGAVLALDAPNRLEVDEPGGGGIEAIAPNALGRGAYAWLGVVLDPSNRVELNKFVSPSIEPIAPKLQGLRAPNAGVLGDPNAPVPGLLKAGLLCVPNALPPNAGALGAPNVEPPPNMVLFGGGLGGPNAPSVPSGLGDESGRMEAALIAPLGLKPPMLAGNNGAGE